MNRANSYIFGFLLVTLASWYEQSLCAEPYKANDKFIENIRAQYGDRALTLAQPYMNRLIEYVSKKEDKEGLKKQDPRLWVGYGFATCKALEEGTRESTLRTGVDSFYGPDSGRAIVQAAKDVICPKFKGPSVEPFSDLRGKIKNDTYVSPGAIYRVKLPPLLQPGAIIEDEQVGDSKYILRMRDDLGSFYSITVTKNEEPIAIPAIIDGLRSAAQLIEKTVVTTPRGEETRLLLFKKGGSHLRSITLKGKEKVESELDLVQATSLFVFRNHIFEVSSRKTPLSVKEYSYKLKLAKKLLEQLLDGLVLQQERETR